MRHFMKWIALFAIITLANVSKGESEDYSNGASEIVDFVPLTQINPEAVKIIPVQDKAVAGSYGAPYFGPLIEQPTLLPFPYPQFGGKNIKFISGPGWGGFPGWGPPPQFQHIQPIPLQFGFNFPPPGGIGWGWPRPSPFL